MAPLRPLNEGLLFAVAFKALFNVPTLLAFDPLVPRRRLLGALPELLGELVSPPGPSFSSSPLC